MKPMRFRACVDGVSCLRMPSAQHRGGGPGKGPSAHAVLPTCGHAPNSPCTVHNFPLLYPLSCATHCRRVTRAEPPTGAQGFYLDNSCTCRRVIGASLTCPKKSPPMGPESSRCGDTPTR